MRKSGLSLLAICLTAVAVPAASQNRIPPGTYTLYDNGPVNGQVNALPINFGYAVTDTFPGSDTVIMDRLTFWVWLSPGDNLEFVDLSIGSTPYGTDQFHETVGTSPGSCFTNRYGANVCEVTIDLEPSHFCCRLWLTLQNAQSSNGFPVYWDQNSGVSCMSYLCPSRALQSYFGPLPSPAALVPSEAFTVYGFPVDSK